MALQAPEEVDYVQATEAKRDAVASQLKQAADNMYKELYRLQTWMVANQTEFEDGLQDTAYGVDLGADAALDTEIGKVEIAITAIFSTGLIAETQAAMEARIEAQLTPPSPPMPPV